jgi:hypothetical protein
MLLTNDPVQLKKLSVSQRIVSSSAQRGGSGHVAFGEFSPALKALFYSGTDVEERKFRGKNTNFALAF